MSCVEVMYQPYPNSLHYQRPSYDQTFSVPKMHEPLDLGPYNNGSLGPAHIKEEDHLLDKDSMPKETHYISSNCVVFTYFTGDTASVVDEHFSRALSQPSSYSTDGEATAPRPLNCKDPPLMAHRNFPPSFWNSTYKSPISSSFMDFQWTTNPYLSSTLHGLSGSRHDPWYHSLSSQSSSAFPHRPMHYDLSAYSGMTGTSRFGPNYGSLFMQNGQFGTVPGHSDFSKSSELSKNHKFGSHFPSHSAISGLENSVPESSKELYWF